MCACVLTIAFTVSLCRPSRSRMRLTSSPGSTTRASRVIGSPMMEQLHCSIPTGMVMCRKPCFSTPTAGLKSSMSRSITNNIKDLTPSQGNVLLQLNAQGRILAEIETYALAESLLCVSYAMIQARLTETLEKYIIMDDVTLTDDTQRFGTLALEGPSAAAIVTELTGVDLNSLVDLERQDARVGTIPCSIIRRSPGKFAGAEFLAERIHLEALWQTLQEKTTAAEGGPTGYSALTALRLEQGIPWFSSDFAEKEIPHKAPL